MNTPYIEGLVSVIMPTYKRSDMLERAIDSVLNQTYSQIELLVVNDNEKGDEYSNQLYTIIKKYSDNRLIFIEQDCHINGAVARNVGIRKARGEFIAFLDDDDYWNKSKIELQVKHLRQLDDSWGGVSCLKLYYRDNTLYKASIPYKDGNIFKPVLLFLTDVTTGTILMRHEALDKAGYFDESLQRAQDIQLFAFFSKKYKIKLLKKYLHYVDATDVQNRPPAEKLVSLRQAYARSVDVLLDDTPELRELLQYHIICGEGFSLIRSKNYLLGSKKIMSTFKHPSVFWGQSEMYIIKVFEGLMKRFLIKKYRNTNML